MSSLSGEIDRAQQYISRRLHVRQSSRYGHFCQFHQFLNPTFKSIRSAKGRLKDVQALVADRFSQFSNVPATLLHIGLLSVDPNDEELRAAAYDLLGSVCDYLNYDRSPLVAARCMFCS